MLTNLQKDIRWFRTEIAECEKAILDVDVDDDDPSSEPLLAALRATLASHRQTLVELEAEVGAPQARKTGLLAGALLAISRPQLDLTGYRSRYRPGADVRQARSGSPVMARFDFFSQEAKRNPFPQLRAIREEGPLVKVDFPIVGKVYLATTWASCGDFLKGGDLFAADARNAGRSSTLGFWWAPRMMRILAQNMLTLDDPDHRRLRKLVEAPFRRDRIEAMRPMIARIADDLIDRMETSDDFDLVRGFSRELPLRVISEMLGLPEDLRLKTQAWMGKFADIAGVVSAASVFPKIGQLMGLMREEFARRRADPRPGLVTELVQAEADGDKLSEDELLAMVFLLFLAGHETTTHLISTSVLDLLQHPDQLDMLKADAALMSNAVEELHRHNSPVQATKPRMARRDMEFHGVQLKQGDRVFGLLASANADPAHFDAPERLDVCRPGVRHAGYGGGMHLCLGMHLARIETEVALARLLARWPSMSLAVPAADIRWLPRPGMRGPTGLPLRVAGLHRRPRAA